MVAHEINVGDKQSELDSLMLAALVEWSDDAIIGKDLDGTITSWNRGAERIFGYSACEMIGTSIVRLIPAERQDEEVFIRSRIQRGEIVEHFATQRRTKDGRLIYVSVTVSPIKDLDGRVIGASKIARDITALKEREHELARVNRLYAALSQINQAIMLTHERDELFTKVCRALVEDGGFQMAWIGSLDQAAGRIDPSAQWGDMTHYTPHAAAYARQHLFTRQPAANAILEGETYICNDLSRDASDGPWREAAARAGYLASAIVPIRHLGGVFGLVNVYAAEADFFKDKEAALLEKVVSQLSFALDNIAREEVRRLAEEALHESEEKLRVVTQNARVGLVMINRERRYTFANVTYAEILDLPSPSVVGRRVADVMGPLYEEQIRPRLDSAFSGKRVAYNLRKATPGCERHYAIKYEPTKTDGEVSFVVAVVTDITEHKQTEQALKAAELRYRALFEYAPDGILTADSQSYYLDANSSICRMLGYSREELIGLHATDILAPVDIPRIAPAQAMINAKSEGPREWEFRRKDGSVFRGEVVATRMPDGNLLGMIRDISERKQMEAAARESEERFRVMANSIPQLAWIAQGDGYIFWYNERWYDYTGTTPEQMEGWGWQRVHDPAMLPDIIQRWEAAIQTGESFEMEFSLRGSDGGFRTFLTRVEPLKDSAGNVVQWFGTNTDVEALQLAQKELREAHRTLEERVIERTAQLEAANRHKSEFLASMSHELRTPLNAIIGFTGTLIMKLPGQLNADQEKQLRIIQTSAQHLLSLINDLLDLAKIEAGKRELLLETVVGQSVVEEVAATLRSLAQSKGLELRVVLPSQECALQTDRRALTQILLNLANNAVKFTRQGSVSIELEPRRDEGSRLVEFRIVDTGPGIGREDQLRLFGVFTRVHSPATRQTEGAGLGLHLSRDLAKLLGGHIELESEPGIGSTFTLVLPVTSPQIPG